MLIYTVVCCRGVCTARNRLLAFERLTRVSRLQFIWLEWPGLPSTNNRQGASTNKYRRTNVEAIRRSGKTGRRIVRTNLNNYCYNKTKVERCKEHNRSFVRMFIRRSRAFRRPSCEDVIVCIITNPNYWNINKQGTMFLGSVKKDSCSLTFVCVRSRLFTLLHEPGQSSLRRSHSPVSKNSRFLQLE